MIMSPSCIDSMGEKMFDAKSYSIVIRSELVEGETLFVGRVLELPDLEEYGCTHSEAYELLLDSIATAQEFCAEKNIPFPSPKPVFDDGNASGRITLRMPKRLHANLIADSESEGVSLNQHIVCLISSNHGFSRGAIESNFELMSKVESLHDKLDRYKQGTEALSVGLLHVAGEINFNQKLEYGSRNKSNQWGLSRSCFR